MSYYGYIPYQQPNAQKVFTNYSQHRIRQILRDDYWCELIPIWEGYKGNRRLGHVKHYKVCRIDTKEIIISDATLNGLRIILGREGYPLHQPVKPNKGAQAFLEHVDMLKQASK